MIMTKAKQLNKSSCLINRTSLPPSYAKNGWLKYDHIVMYKKYTTSLPLYGMWSNRNTSSARTLIISAVAIDYLNICDMMLAQG